MDIRLGNGFDVHRFTPDRPLRLCGVEIPSDMGLLGHSDADVAIHALCDAMLGALAMRDIGYHFPDSAASTDGIDSRILLSRVNDMIKERGFRIANVDVTIIAQKPKLMTHIPAMAAELARVLGIDSHRVSVKATTTERLGFTGRGEGIAAQATALLISEA